MVVASSERSCSLKGDIKHTAFLAYDREGGSHTMSQVRGPQPQQTHIGHMIRTDERAGLDTKGRAGGPVLLFWRAYPLAWQGGLIVEAPPFLHAGIQIQ